MPKPKRGTALNRDSDQALALLEKIANDSNQILDVLQDLFILEAARAGMSNEAIRNTIKITNTRVSAIAKHIPHATD